MTPYRPIFISHDIAFATPDSMSGGKCGHYCLVAVVVPDSASGHPITVAGREYVMVMLATPPVVTVICPVNELTLLLHAGGASPVAVIAPDEDTVPEVKTIPCVP